jgi:hypothetical protein
MKRLLRNYAHASTYMRKACFLPENAFGVISFAPNSDNPHTLFVGAMKYGLLGMTRQRTTLSVRMIRLPV